MFEEVLISHHSHTDIGYTHEQPVLWELQERYIERAMDLIEATWDEPVDAQMKWTCEVTAPVFRWLRKAPVSQVERFIRLIETGHIEVMALFCNLTPLYDLEELHRAVLGTAWLEREYGIRVRAAMNSDVNGLPWPIVDILLDAGIHGLTMAINEHMGGAPLNRPNAFQWIGPSGRSLFVYNGLHYGHLQRFGLGETGVAEAYEKVTEELRNIYKKSPAPVLYVQNTRLDFWDNNPPQEKLSSFVREWNETGLKPRLILVTPSEALKRLKGLDPSSVPEHAGDWTDYWNFGSGSSVEPLRINRRSRRYLITGDQIGSLIGRDDRDARLSTKAWEQLMLFDEHTWGAWCSISEPRSELTRAQWAFKEGYANKAAALSQFIRRRAIADLAERIQYDGESPAVLVYNPHSRPITRRLRIPRSWNDPSLPTQLPHQHTWDTYARKDTEYMWTEPIDTPPLGWRVVPIDDVLATTGDKGEHFQWNEEVHTLRTPHYTLRFDPDRVGLVSWKRNDSEVELIDVQAPYTFGQAVLEQCTALSGRDALWTQSTGWKPNWPARRVTASPVGPVEVAYGPGLAQVSQRLSLPEWPVLTWTLKVHADRPELEIDLCGQFPDRLDPEAVYLMFPWRSEPGAGWHARYTTAGQAVKYDAEQLPGSCRDYITTDTWVYLEGKGPSDHGIQVISPDQPLFMFGGFQFGKRLFRTEDHAPSWLAAWVSNNYWQTNFRASQPGPFEQRYFIFPQEGGISDDELHAVADELLAELVLHPIPRAQSGPEPDSGRFLDLDLGSARLMSIIEAEAGDGLVMRLQNPNPGRVVVHVAPARLKVEKAWLCDTLERPVKIIPVSDGRFRIDIASRSIATLKIACS